MHKMHTQTRYATCFGMFKIKDAYPKKVCHMPTRHDKKKREKGEKKKIAPIQRKKRNKREMIHTKEFIHHPPKIYFHTLAHLDQGL